MQKRKVKVRVKCVFMAPLLMDRMSIETLEELRTGVRAQKVKDRPLSEVAAEKIYRENGNEGPIGLQQEMLFACLVAAGRNVKNGKGKISTAKTTTLPDLMTIEEFFIPLVSTDGPLEESWIPDRRRGRLADGTAVCVVRPKFPALTTRFEFTIEYDKSKVADSVIRELVNNAGSAQGLGSFRPNCKGPFGRFRIMVKELDGQDGWLSDTDNLEEETAPEPTTKKSRGGRRRVVEVPAAEEAPVENGELVGAGAED